MVAPPALHSGEGAKQPAEARYVKTENMKENNAAGRFTEPPK